ncbi:MAG TPA: class I tRNA ligase family protein [Thermoplasmata archaeon]|nr:class I tRNA ligase family protein [Thermoplasmata archaeon]
MELRLDDSLSGRRRPVRRRDGPAARLYICGPTVYDAAHVGHARTYLYFDVVRRFLEAEGVPVRHVMNITDVEDKIDERAAALGTSPRALARREERSFLANLDALGVRAPDATPRASEYVPAMVAVGRALERTGRVHRTGDEWYYEPPARPAGANFLSGADLAARAVAEPGHPFRPERGDGRSFMVWKRQERPRPSWRSPWGPGVPGWHLECFAMAERLLGVPVDLHGGARDLVYPHHYAENEVALELEGRPFSDVYLHFGFVLQDGSKMSKSVGNLVPLRTALAAVGPGALRWYLLDRPPADRLEWDAHDLRRAAAEYDGIRRAIARWAAPGGAGRGTAARARTLAESVRRELAGGLRTDRAFARIRAFAREVGREPTGRVAKGEGPAARTALRTVEERTGLALV